MKVRFKFFCLWILFFTLSSCTNCANVFQGVGQNNSVLVGESIYCVTYNTQTFFDAVQDGYEFKEFKGSKSKWSAEKYKTRLNRLREVGKISVQALGGKKNRMPDIFILQEIESLRVIEDFAKQFSASEGYDNVVFFPPSRTSSFSSAIFSRFPIVDFQQFQITNLNFKAESLRPLIKATLEIDRGKTCDYLTIFAVHWKSKLGENTELIRQVQEKQLINQVKKTLENNPSTNILVCGDFNQQLDEFSVLNNSNLLISSWEFFDNIHNFTEQGSYYYKNEWEKIDHIFFSGNLNDNSGLEVIDFIPIATDPLVNENGIPNKFLVYNGKGYSDHIPLGCVLQFVD